MSISQDRLSFIRRPNRTVHISCRLSGVPLENAIVHWYQQKEGEPLRRILYGSTKNSKDNKLNPRMEAYRKGGTFNLIINNVIKSDEAIYYCACWDLTMSQSHKGPVRKPSLLQTLSFCHTCVATTDCDTGRALRTKPTWTAEAGADSERASNLSNTS